MLGLAEFFLNDLQATLHMLQLLRGLLSQGVLDRSLLLGLAQRREGRFQALLQLFDLPTLLLALGGGGLALLPRPVHFPVRALFNASHIGLLRLALLLRCQAGTLQLLFQRLRLLAHGVALRL
ncbi:hypothetical protein D9M70_598310 [compost metagenome]